MNYQYCSRCDALTDRCEEDALLNADGRPLCEECFDAFELRMRSEGAAQGLCEESEVVK